LGAETRVAALWFVLFGNHAEAVDEAVEMCQKSLDNTNSEYRVSELPKLLGVERAKPLVVLWQQYVQICASLAAGVARVFDYRQAVRFWALYVATVRLAEVTEIVRELKANDKPSRRLIRKLVSGGTPDEGSISLSSFDDDWNEFERHQNRLERDEAALKKLLRRSTPTKRSIMLMNKMEIPQGTKIKLLGFYFNKQGVRAAWRLSGGDVMRTSIDGYMRDCIDGFPEEGVTAKMAQRHRWEPPPAKKGR
jgi:hypothetical protein